MILLGDFFTSSLKHNERMYIVPLRPARHDIKQRLQSNYVNCYLHSIHSKTAVYICKLPKMENDKKLRQKKYMYIILKAATLRWYAHMFFQLVVTYCHFQKNL